MESCPAKTVISGVIGFGMGGVFGMLMSSFNTESNEEIMKLRLREQMRRIGREMWTRSYASAKNLSVVGAAFAGSECIIETVGITTEQLVGNHLFLLLTLSIQSFSQFTIISTEQRTTFTTASRRGVSREAPWQPVPVLMPLWQVVWALPVSWVDSSALSKKTVLSNVCVCSAFSAAIDYVMKEVMH